MKTVYVVYVAEELPNDNIFRDNDLYILKVFICANKESAEKQVKFLQNSKKYGLYGYRIYTEIEEVIQ